jgi:hypothetical protein
MLSIHYVNFGEMESKYGSLAWKLGLHPSTLPHLSNTRLSYLPKEVPLARMDGWTAVRTLPCNRLFYKLSIVCTVFGRDGTTGVAYILAWKKGFHPVTFAPLADSFTSFP